jgi:hypothetical protein
MAGTSVVRLGGMTCQWWKKLSQPHLWHHRPLLSSGHPKYHMDQLDFGVESMFFEGALLQCGHLPPTNQNTSKK